MSGSLVHSPAHVVQWLLVALGVGTSPNADPLAAWPIYEDLEPQSPDNVLTVYDTTPRIHGRTNPDGETQQHYGVQVRVRSTTKEIGWAKANDVVTAFDLQYQDVVTVDGSSYHVHAIHHGGIIRLGKNVPQTKRSLYTINVMTSIRQV